jgi:hypothetical protein
MPHRRPLPAWVARRAQRPNGLSILVVIFNDKLLEAKYHKSMGKGLNADLARVTTPGLGAVTLRSRAQAIA